MTEKEKLDIAIKKGAWKSQKWRLNHLYYIERKSAPPCRFKMNWAQEELFDNLHTRNNVLKARQLGISTLTSLMALDNCLFNRNFHAGIIDKAADDAKEKMKKIRFALRCMEEPPDGADDAVTKFARLTYKAMAPQMSAMSIRFSNGSDVRAGTSLRGGTLQFLHISEFGHIAANFPQKAVEVTTGSLNAVPATGIVVMESTHEGGKFGENYRMTKAAMDKVGKKLLPLDFKFFFFPWWKQQEYKAESDEKLVLDSELRDYFRSLENDGILLDEAQKRWYAAQYSAFGAMTRQEYPSTAEEAFHVRVDGSIYGSIISSLRAEGRMAGDFEADPEKPLFVSWDIGLSDNMSLWLIQPSGRGRFLVLDHYTANNKDLSHFIAHCRKWEGFYCQAVALHLLPHDASKRDVATGVCFADHFRKQSMPCVIVPRTHDVWAAIDVTRRFLRYCSFHSRCSDPVNVDGVEYMSGINALENYRTAPLGASGAERREPLHDACSHSADAFRTFAQAWQAGFVGRDEVRPPLTRGERAGGFGLRSGRVSLRTGRQGLAKGVPWG